MRIWRRWTGAVFSRVDALATRIENHDALVSAAIHDAQAARARATVQLGRVREDGRRMRERVDALTEAEARWRDRAARLAAEDETRAIECLRRRRRAASERARLEERRREHEEHERRLAADLQRIAERVEQLVSRRNLLRTRQSRAQAMAAAREYDGVALSEIDEIVERWETRVLEGELHAECGGGPMPDTDELEIGCLAEEEKAELREELAGLRQSAGSGGSEGEGR